MTSNQIFSVVHFIPIRMVHFNPIRVAHFIPLKVVHLFPILSIYTTNTVDGYHRQIRKVTKNKGVFPSDTALEKLVYLAYRNISEKWTMPLANWALIEMVVSSCISNFSVYILLIQFLFLFLQQNSKHRRYDTIDRILCLVMFNRVAHQEYATSHNITRIMGKSRKKTLLMWNGILS